MTDIRTKPTLPLMGRVTVSPEKGERSGGVNRSRQLRKAMTGAEKKMWHILRDMKWPSTHFRRQVKIGPYYADFLSHSFKLIIEVDGSQHFEEPALAYDAIRSKFLNAEGYLVLRFDNADVLRNSSGVHDAIAEALNERAPTPNPSPQGGGANMGVEQ